MLHKSSIRSRPATIATYSFSSDISTAYDLECSLPYIFKSPTLPPTGCAPPNDYRSRADYLFYTDCLSPTDDLSHTDDTSFELPPSKRRRVSPLSRSTSVDLGRATYYKNWKSKNFKPCSAIETETNPSDIAQLWDFVSMGLTKDEKAANKGSLIPTLPGQKMTTRSSASKSATETVASTAESQKPRRLTPYDEDFDDQILGPRSIQKVVASSIICSAHFRVPEPEGNRKEYYTQKRRAPDTQIWLEPSNDFVAEVAMVYDAMEREGLVEAEFASYAKEFILKFDPQAMNPAAPRGWRTRRMIEFVAKPGDNFWKVPPVVDHYTQSSTPVVYDFDLRPDCAYWISLQAMNPTYRSEVADWSDVRRGQIAWPYFTIEFKRQDKTPNIADSQVMAAGSLALYNRFLLRKKRMTGSGKSWTERDKDAIRHYTLTMQGSAYTMWCMRPKLAAGVEWSGCDMTRVSQGRCVEQEDVRKLIFWINEIHCWGLTRHGLGCLNDVKIILGKNPLGVRTSAVGVESVDDEGLAALAI